MDQRSHKMGGLIVIVILLIFFLVPCLFSFLQRALQRTTNAAYLVEKQLEEGFIKFRVERASWLDDLFDWLSLAPLWRELLKSGMYVLIVIIVTMVLVPCLVQCVRQWFNKAVKAVFMVQTGSLLVIHEEQ